MIAELLEMPPVSLYSLDASQKEVFLSGRMNKLFRYHYSECSQFRDMMDAINYLPDIEYKTVDLPFLPVRLFKLLDLLSVNKEDVVKTMTSSGTTGQTVSRIYLDRHTSALQTKALTSIVAGVLGTARMPMLIIDSEATIRNRNSFSARAAGILGFSIFGSKKQFALNDDMSLNEDVVIKFLEENRGKRVFLFGFTYIVFLHFYKSLITSNISIDLSNAVMIHGGGWKKLQDQAVDSAAFRNDFRNLCGLNSIHDYYGMVEQTGSIYIECEEGFFHAPEYADIFIRSHNDFSELPVGERGVIQTLSILPLSYPGISLLTEDEGVLCGIDDCSCGRKGKYFKILGRLPKAELRGCSDTYESSARIG